MPKNYRYHYYTVIIDAELANFIASAENCTDEGSKQMALQDYAIQEARERAQIYIMPAVWYISKAFYVNVTEEHIFIVGRKSHNPKYAIANQPIKPKE